MKPSLRFFNLTLLLFIVLYMSSSTTITQLEKISARCHESSQAVNERRCKHLKFMRAFMLDKNYRPTRFLCKLMVSRH